MIKAQEEGYVDKDKKKVEVLYRGRGGRVKRWDSANPEQVEEWGETPMEQGSHNSPH